MSYFNVIDKSDNVLVYQYEADAAIEWDQYPFSLYDHAVHVPNPPAPVSIYGGRTDLTHLEFRDLFTDDEIQGIDEFSVTFEGRNDLTSDVKRRIRTNLKSFDAATYVDLKDDKVAMGLGVYAGLGIIAPERISEILNG